jgi:Domain of unknown function (DUF1918)
MPSTARTKTKPGDIVKVTRHHVGETARSGEILELLGDPDHERYRVRWDDGHESIFTPGSDTVVEHTKASRQRRT